MLVLARIKLGEITKKIVGSVSHPSIERLNNCAERSAPHAWSRTHQRHPQV